MPESRGGGSSGGEGRFSSAGMRAGQAPSWRMEGAEEEEGEEDEGSSGSSPDILDVDLRMWKSSCSQHDLWSLLLEL